MISNNNTIGDIFAGSLRCAGDLHDFLRLNSKVFSNWVLYLDFWQLVFFDSVFLHQLLLLLWSQHLMLWYERMFCDVHLKIVNSEGFNRNLVIFCQFFLSHWSHSIYDHESSLRVLIHRNELYFLNVFLICVSFFVKIP